MSIPELMEQVAARSMGAQITRLASAAFYCPNERFPQHLYSRYLKRNNDIHSSTN